MHLFSVAGLGLLASVADASLQIVSGATWTATNNGQGVQAHGGGMIKEGNKWYWVGEDKTNGSAFQNINCYSSTDLVNWSYEGALLSRTASGDTGPNRVIERPKVVHNKKTGKYVLWMHIDSSDYSEAKAGVATGDTVCGKYTYVGSSRPLGFQSRDSGVFVDDDGKGYLLSEDRQNGLRIDALSDDYLTVTKSVHLFNDDYEAPALIKKNGVYFIFGSKLSGWNPNDNRYSTATSLSGPWSSWNTFADPGSNTYASQTTFVLPIGNNFMYMGDRWHSDNLMRSTYIWLPLNISGTTASMKNSVNWIVNPSTGAMSVGPSENTYEGESGTLANGAKVVSCSGCSGGNFAGYIGGPSDGSVTFASVQSSATTTTTIRIKYRNGDSTQRYATINVNGKTQKIAFFPTIGSDPGTSVANVELKQGANQIKISGIDGGWGPDIDRLLVPKS